MAITNKLKRPDLPGAIDKTAVKTASQGVSNAKDTLNSMNYDAYKQGTGYEGLKKSYEQQGQRAMQDTLGQIAARTGGMASSYAGSAAQQSYNNYMQTLEDAARAQFNEEYSKAKDNYNMALQEYNNAYGEYRDQYSDAWDRYNAESKVYEDDRDAEIDRVYNSAYYGNAPTFADYKASGGTLDEATYNSIVLQGSGKRTDESRADVDTEYERIFGAEGFNWNEWLNELDTNEDGTTSEDELAAFFGKSSYDADYWRQFAEDEGRTTAASDIEARIANGESLDDIATEYEIGTGDKTWESVTGKSKAEWREIYNDNETSNYTYSNDAKGREAIMTVLTDSASFSLTEKDQKNFDHIYGDGAYDTLQNGVNQLARELPMALIAWENEAHSNNTKTYDPEYFDRLLTDWYNEMGTLIPGIKRDQLSDIINMHFPELAEWVEDPNSAKPFIGKAFVDGRWITPAG